MRDRPLILFLGNNYNPFSLACAAALLDTPAWGVAVGIHDDARNGSVVRMVRRAVNRHGWRFVMRRAWLLARSRARVTALRAGVRLPGTLSLEELALAHRLTWFRCPQVNSPPSLDAVRSLAPDLIIVGGFSQILRGPLLAIPRLGSVNVHPSLLPRYRGPNPLFWVLANGEHETGVTIHLIDHGIDSGAIVAQERIAIGPNDDERTLLGRSAQDAARLLRATLPQLLRGATPRVPQRAEDATYFPLPPRGASRL